VVLDVVLFLAGLVALYFGAEWLVGGASRIATSMGIAPLVVGLTVVSFGTSAPELVVSGLASWRGAGDLAVGNIVGSNIANIALILGAAALIRPLAVQRGLVVRDVPIMIATVLLLQLLMWTGIITRLEGVLLLVIFVFYMVHLMRDARKEAGAARALLEQLPGETPERPSRRRDLLLIAGGTVGLVVGAQLLVGSASAIARELGVSEVVIGLTFVAFGTSVPELAASVVASLKGEAQIVLGNIIGSNIFNVTLILGAASLLRPIPVPPTVVRVEGPILIVLSVALLPLILTRHRVNRWEGGLLVLGYVAFVIWLFVG
jgi:cation:H+ antiporter